MLVLFEFIQYQKWRGLVNCFYDKDNIFDFLYSGFSDEELRNLCFRTRGFEHFYHELSSDLKKSPLVRELVDYAIRQELIKPLLDAASKLNPNRYQTYQKDKPFFDSEQAKIFAAEERKTINNLRMFFNLNPGDSTISIYLSRHVASSKMPMFTRTSDSFHPDPAIRAIFEHQETEKSQSQQYSADEFAVVSAIEVLEAQYLKEELVKSRLHKLIPEYERREKLLRTDPIKVNISVCPEPSKYEEMLREGTTILVGGPRANLGTYYYLYGYGGKAGIMRPGRLEKNIVECINFQDKIDCDAEHNLGIIQRHRLDDTGKTIVYLAGTGANGTAAAIAYLRQSWLKLLDKYEGNFALTIKVPGGKVRQEDFKGYGPEYWNAGNWEEVDLRWD
jgi:hypothetical protein